MADDDDWVTLPTPHRPMSNPALRGFNDLYKIRIDGELRETIGNMTPAEWERWQRDHPRPKIIFSGWSDGGSTGTLDWYASSTQPGFISCRICNHTIILEPGEAMNFDHPDLCEHGKSND